MQTVHLLKDFEKRSSKTIGPIEAMGLENYLETQLSKCEQELNAMLERLKRLNGEQDNKNGFN